MISVDVFVFRKNIKKYLSTPCQVTRYGKPIASIVPAVEVKEIVPPAEKVEKVEKVVSPPGRKVTFKYNGLVYLCPHGKIEGVCEFGCMR